MTTAIKGETHCKKCGMEILVGRMECTKCGQRFCAECMILEDGKGHCPDCEGYLIEVYD